jgi:hypothetical protein
MLNKTTIILSVLFEIILLLIFISSENLYFWLSGGVFIATIIFIAFYYYFKYVDKKMTEIFESTMIDDIVSVLSSDISLDKNKLHKIILDLITNNIPLPLSLKNLSRIEYQLEKKNPDIVCRTVIVAMNRDSGIVLKKLTREISWENLPSKIRHSFIIERKDSLFYSLYPNSEVNHDITRSTN